MEKYQELYKNLISCLEISCYCPRQYYCTDFLSPTLK